MSIYTPRGNSLKAVRHEPGPTDSGPYWMIHDDHGEYDGPWASEATAQRQINDIAAEHDRLRQHAKKFGGYAP